MRSHPWTALTAALVAALAGAAALVLRPSPARADLEVTIPPGMPADWTQELPERQPRVRAVQTEKEKPKEAPKEDGKKGGTGLRDKENISTTEVQAKPELGSATYQPKLFSGVLTDDLPFHVPWVTRKGDMVTRVYPPTVSDDLYWTAQAAYLRRLLHPALVPEAQTYWYLILMGDSAREVSAGAKGERFLEALASAVESAIEKAPADAPGVPEAQAGDNPELTMVLRMTRDDLMGGDPMGLDPTYAARVLSLGDAGLPPLLRCAAHPHVILRRNAISLLRGYAHPDATAALRKAWKEEKDLCAKTRALFALIDRKDPEIVPDLVKGLEPGGDKRFPPLAAWGLGVVGAKEAVPALVQAIEGAGEDWELLVPATVALARAAAATGQQKEALPVLKKLEASLRAEKPRFVEDASGTRPAPDVPDAPPVKNRMLLELATVALARLGDKEGVQRLALLTAGKYEDAKSPVGHANASGPEKQYQCDALKWVCPSAQESLVETWAVVPGDGPAKLKQAIDHLRTNEHLRVSALRSEPIAKDKVYLAGAATTAESATVRGLALRMLYNADEKAGVKVAESVMALYAQGKPMSKGSPKGDVSVVTALEVLFRAKKLKSAPLKPALARAVTEFEYLKPEVSAEGMKPFRFSPPILETVCWMLGAAADKDAVPVLKKIAADPKLPARAEAALALGRIATDPAKQALVELLDDEDGWIRYCAFLALRGATSADHFADWIYGSKADREAAAGAYRDLVKKKK